MDPNAASEPRAAAAADVALPAWLTRQRPAQAAAVLGAGAVVVCGLLALALTEVLAPAGRWAAPLAAAIGMLTVSVPLGVLLLKLARRVERQAERLTAAAGTSEWLIGRPAFLALVEREWARARRYGGGIAVLVFEVDRLRKLMDVHGAAVAEAVVVAMARDIGRTLRGGDALARLSETQLAVFLGQADPTGTLDAAERIRERLEQLDLPWQGTVLRATVSIGAATTSLNHANVSALLDDAHFAVLLARQAGGNCVRTRPPGARPLQSPDSSVDDNQRAGPL